MVRALSTYSIESEQSIVLLFRDGTRMRCKPEALPEHLGKRDLERVSKALSLRKQFIKRVLPPTAIVAMLAATIYLGSYDYRRYQQITSQTHYLGPTALTALPVPRNTPVISTAPQLQEKQVVEAPLGSSAADLQVNILAPATDPDTVLQATSDMDPTSIVGLKSLIDQTRNPDTRTLERPKTTKHARSTDSKKSTIKETQHDER